MEVIAIDDSDTTGFLECVTTIGEITFNSIQTFTDNVCSFLNGANIDLLHIQVHGNTAAVYFGDNDVLTVDSLKSQYRGTLGLLAPLFNTGAWVHLRACDIGQNFALLMNLAGMWNVTVCAGRGAQNNILDFNTGSYVTVQPDGTTSVTFFEPDEAKYGAPVTPPVNSPTGNGIEP